jgi:hypothetical protein
MDGDWTAWYTDQDDLSFLRDNKSITEMEVIEEITRDDVEKYPRGGRNANE